MQTKNRRQEKARNKKKYETATNKIAKYNSVNDYFKCKLSKYTIKVRVAIHNCSSP